MNYKLIPKDPKNQPPTGNYTEWKDQISRECYKCCVYCSIHENQWGGIDHYHIDHFRPKSKFKHLINDICNLFYACPICNRFKSDDWPSDPDLTKPSYPDPSITDYNSIFSFDAKSHQISGSHVSANYLILRLYLNRPQLVYERRETALKGKEAELFQEVASLASESGDNQLMRKAFYLLGEIRRHLGIRELISPYKLSEIRKP